MQLPISTLKIDRTFISPITENGGNTEIVETIVMLARNLGMKIIAEGVETVAQVEQLKKFNCESAQGYYFSKPLCFDDIQMFINGVAEVQSVVPESKFEDVSIVSVIQ